MNAPNRPIRFRCGAQLAARLVIYIALADVFVVVHQTTVAKTPAAFTVRHVIEADWIVEDARFAVDTAVLRPLAASRSFPWPIRAR